MPSIYKYLSPERTSILKDGLIRFSQPQAFNDPFEMKPYIKKISNLKELEYSYEEKFDDCNRPEYEKLPRNVRRILSYAEFSEMVRKKKDQALQHMDRMQNELNLCVNLKLHTGLEKYFGILSLTENQNNLLMWAHYAGSHHGYVVEFDSLHPFFNQKKSENDTLRSLRKVIYSEDRPQLTLCQVKEFDEFSVKSRDWSYEQEWRMTLPLQDADKTIKADPYDIHLFRVPFEAIKSVIIGARATEEKINEIKNALQENKSVGHVKLYQMRIHDTRFELIMDSVNFK